MVRIIQTRPEEVEKLKDSIGSVLEKTIRMLRSIKDPDTMNEEDWIRLMAAFPVFVMTTGSVALEADLEERDSVRSGWSAAMESMRKIPLLEGFETLAATVIQKRGVCPAYEEGDTFEITSPFFWPKRCPALWFSAWPYVIAAGFGYKSWESDDNNCFRISCPSRKGLVIQMIQKKHVL